MSCVIFVGWYCAGDFSDLIAFIPSSQEWINLNGAVDGTAPTPRYAHKAASAAGKLFIHGGYDTESGKHSCCFYYAQNSCCEARATRIHHTSDIEFILYFSASKCLCWRFISQSSKVICLPSTISHGFCWKGMVCLQLEHTMDSLHLKRRCTYLVESVPKVSWCTRQDCWPDVVINSSNSWSEFSDHVYIVTFSRWLIDSCCRRELFSIQLPSSVAAVFAIAD